MRKFRGDTRQFLGGDYYDSIVTAGDINNTFVTNVTNVRVTKGYGAANAHKRPHRARKHFGEKRKRPPKLFRYCASCGILDGDVVHGMSSGQLCDESVKVMGYAAKGIASNIHGMAHDTCDIVHAAGKLAVCTGGLALGLGKIVYAFFAKDD